MLTQDYLGIIKFFFLKLSDNCKFASSNKDNNFGKISKTLGQG